MEHPGSDTAPVGIDRVRWYGRGLVRVCDRCPRVVVWRGRRASTRAVSNMDALVLGQTGFTGGNSHSACDWVGVYYAVTPDGSLLQLYGEDAYLHASNGFNWRSVVG